MEFDANEEKIFLCETIILANKSKSLTLDKWQLYSYLVFTDHEQ